MKKIVRVLIPLLILCFGLGICWWLISSRAAPKQRTPPPTVTKVDAVRVSPTSFQVIVSTQGTVRPRTEGTFLPEVSGRIIEVAPNFNEGGFFEEGDVLLKIDPLNYETALIVAQGQLAQAEVGLIEEEARADQALANWRSLGKKGEPSSLVMREPQLAEAKARLAAANAQVEKAQRDLNRTSIRAPYAGRILEKQVDLGQVVGQNTVLASAYAVDFVEVRMPLSNEDLAFVDLEENFRGNKSGGGARPKVALKGDIGGESAIWEGELVRVSGAIDSRSRQLFVVAQVNDPYTRREDGTPPLKIGLFVDAAIEGRTLENVIILPSSAVRSEGEVIVIKEDNTIFRQSVKPVWSDSEQVLIPVGEGGLNTGDVVCLTPLSYPTNGASVAPTIEGEASLVSAELKGGGGSPGGGGKPGGPDFAQMDANKDGVISKNEAPERMQGRWDKVDVNGDGQLDESEQRDFSTNMRGGA